MDFKTILDMIFMVIGGLGLFLLGMRRMSDGMQAVAGRRLRKLISAVTTNRVLACGVGVLVTGIIQSSSITTVMVVGFVNSSFMTLTQALGVILGADIGTTVTAWIIALNFGKWGLPLLGVSALVYLFTKRDRARYIALTILGIGMIFFGLELMKNGFKPIKTDPEFMAWFTRFAATTYWGAFKCALVGCFVTMVIQSSSATIGITIGLAYQGIIPFQTAAALVLGENIGTTITALLASIGATTNAKRAAYGHCLIKIIGVTWMFPFFFIYIHFIQAMLAAGGIDVASAVGENGDMVYPFVGSGIALLHSIFNILNVSLFLVLLPYLARFLVKVVPEKEHKEAPHLTQLDTFLVETPVIGIEQSRVELLRMCESVKRQMQHLGTFLKSAEPDENLIQKIFHREEVLDIMQKEITVFLAHLLSAELPMDVTEEARLQLRMADELESISDYIANLLKAYLRMHNQGVKLPEMDMRHVQVMHEVLTEYMNLVVDGLEQRNPDVLSKAKSQGEAISHKLRELRDNHIRQLSEVRIDPLASSSYSDMLTCYRRIKDHTFNVAEAIAGRK